MVSRFWPLALLITAPAVAQEPASSRATPTVDGYLCTFAGKCNGETVPQATRDAPETRGFRLARPTTAVKMSSSASRRSPSAGLTRTPRPPRSYGRAAARGYAAVTPEVSAPATPAAGTRRADLLIGFELNSARLTSEGTYAAQIFARSLLLPELRDRRFRIEGHTDLRGGRAVNTSLSALRAKAVADYLVVLGVDRDRLEARGYGSSAPLPGRPVTDPANRRVEAELIR